MTEPDGDIDRLTKRLALEEASHAKASHPLQSNSATCGI